MIWRGKSIQIFKRGISIHFFRRGISIQILDKSTWRTLRHIDPLYDQNFCSIQVNQHKPLFLPLYSVSLLPRLPPVSPPAISCNTSHRFKDRNSTCWEQKMSCYQRKGNNKSTQQVGVQQGDTGGSCREKFGGKVENKRVREERGINIWWKGRGETNTYHC